jgi:hypothetical protein
MIRLAILQKATTEEEVCKTFGISKQTLSKWINRENKPHQQMVPIVENYIKDLLAIKKMEDTIEEGDEK